MNVQEAQEAVRDQVRLVRSVFLNAARDKGHHIDLPSTEEVTGVVVDYIKRPTGQSNDERISSAKAYIEGIFTGALLGKVEKP